ncbi:MAG: ABC transporter permease [Anaerolineales bacterium]
MYSFIVRRIIRGVIALLAFQFLLFALIHSLPGDFASIAGGFAGTGARAVMQRQLGLDQPLLQQYLTWIKGSLQLDFGQSFLYQENVSGILLDRAPRTLLLFLSAAALSYVLGIWLGKVVAWRRGGLFEFGTLSVGLAAHTSFAPWLAFLGLGIFAWNLGWLPYQHFINFNVWLGTEISVDEILLRMLLTGIALFGVLFLSRLISSRFTGRRRAIGAGFFLLGVLIAITLWQRSGHSALAVDVLKHLTLPLGTVVLLSFGETMMTMRATMLETIGEDHVEAARAKGLPDKAIRDRHVARIAMLPVLTRILLSLPFVLVGSLVIERVFFWRAMGQVVFNAVEFQDLPLIVGVLTMIGLITLLAHIILDVLYVALDPRLRYV